MIRRLLVLGVLAIVASVGVVHAQFPGVAQDLIARGRVDYAEAVGGPADVVIGSIRIEPGARYGGWHTHPGPVWVVVNAGELAVYGPDNCRTAYRSGAAFVTATDTLYDLRNESSEFVDLTFAGVVPAGQPATALANEPGTSCAR